MKTLPVGTLLSFAVLVGGCRSPHVLCPPPTVDEAVVTLDQGWDAEQQVCFYDTTQGSQLIPFSWAIALERPQDEALFLSDENIDDLGFLPRGFDSAAENVEAHLPIGFVKDGDKDELGFTCAACHTSQLEFRGNKLRVDGAGTLGDMPRLLLELTKSVETTLDSNAKLNRFVDRVLGSNPPASESDKLVAELTNYRTERRDYDRRNASDLVPGNGRLDAFGRIFNKALALTEAGEDNFNPPDAPVSYPFLWGTHQSDFVQWNGFASNANIGPIARNIGEVLGVFAEADIKSDPHRYASSARAENLIQLEEWVRHLQAPIWREDVLGPIDRAKAERGSVLYTEYCVKCHNRVDRTDIDREVIAWMENLESIGTDPKTATNILSHRGKTGILEGRKAEVIAGDKFLDVATADNITGNVVLGLLLAKPVADIETELAAIRQGRGGKGPTKQGNYHPDNPLNNEPKASFLAYKGRSLTGAWATAPFLHNGSIPNMWQLLTREDDRVKQFDLGSREFDPVNLGFPINQVGAKFTFKVEDANGDLIAGNSNRGHSGKDFGTELSDADKWALIEYMKTEMNALQ